MLGYLGYYDSVSLVTVPNIVGLTTSAASSALTAVGLVLGSSTGSTTSGANSGNNGYVASQSVTSGSQIAAGTTITYTTYYYEPPPCVPNWYDSGPCIAGCEKQQSDGCGNTRTVSCADVVYVSTVSEYLIGQNSTTCFYQSEDKYQNTCTGAISYQLRYWNLPRACPTCSCMI